MAAKNTNRLAHESSPYLLQHAHNPVDWYPWGSEALERAKQEDKPILLSIGYSACHWCHVMERESFENEQIAALMNDNFVCIKVDREERPDVDSIYMNAVQMMTGHGGWPLTVFLKPDLKPFYGGTYFPPADRHGMPGFPRILMSIGESYRTRKDDIATSADAITAELRKAGSVGSPSDMLTTEILDEASSRLRTGFDSANGGFGSAPKFPPSMSLMFLLRQHKRIGSSIPLEMAELTLDKMAGGGMYDHLGGGFHRYSVDERWLVPHFEKMLYDNALLARVYLYAYQLTRKPKYRQVAEETLEYVMRDMAAPSGGFYSSEDADSEGAEGKFYVWTLEEITEVLGETDARLFADYYDVTSEGNFEDRKSILNTPRPLDDVAAEHGMKVGALSALLAAARKKLFYSRETRVRPGRDEKILTAWNGLMITAFAEAARILERDDYARFAARNADFVLSELSKDGRLLRSFSNGKAKLNGYLDDYSYMIEALIAVYEATFEISYFDHARQFAESIVRYFGDESSPGFFYTSSDHEELIARMKDFFDNATPSGNSVAALSLMKIALLTGELRYQHRAISILRSMQQPMSRYSQAFGYLLCALDFYLADPKEIAIIGPAESHEVRLFIQSIYSRFLPNKVVACSEPEQAHILESISLLRGRQMVESKPTVYVCRDYSCLAPVTSPHELEDQLE